MLYAASWSLPVLNIKLWQPTKLLQQQSNIMLFGFFFIFIAKCHLFKALFIPISLQTFPVFLWTFYIQNMFQVFFFVFLHFILFFHSWTMYISAKKVCLTHSYTN